VWDKNRRLIATQSDSRKVYLWDIVSQGSVKDKVKMAASTPDLILEGHEAVADYALAWSPTAPIIASGGKDKKILLWNIETFL
jgi:histone-binding protein RBBP4